VVGVDQAGVAIM